MEKDWLKVIVACISFIFTLVVFIYTNFVTRAEATRDSESIRSSISEIKSDVKEMNRLLRGWNRDRQPE